MPRISIMVCDLEGAARRGHLPPGWLEHRLFLASSPTARIAIVAYCASSCVTQRAVALVARSVPQWVGYGEEVDSDEE